MARKPARVLSGAQILAIEVLIYTVLVAAYLVLILHTISPYLLEASRRSRGLYAAACLLLMLGQGILLEFLTTWLVARYARAHREEALDAMEREK